MANEDIKFLAKENGVYLWQVAERYGCADGNFSRKLRHELSDAEKSKIKSIIAELRNKEA